ncbi:hypothetical protein [Lacipirellula sp.]|uniref:hypothetical protein n=1 Tax=Lacipirellula sp. TaxID=2691419 RepID=UPI003D141D6E
MHNRLQNHFRTAAEAAESRVSAAAAAADEAVADFAVTGEGIVNRTARSVASHPALAIGAAFAVGLLIGKWVKR